MRDIVSTKSDFLSHCEGIVLKYPRIPVFIFILTCTALLWIIGYGFEATNVMFSHDSLLVDSATDANWEIGQGRFLQILYWQLRGPLSAPLLINVLAILWLSITCYLVVSILNITHPLIMFLAVGILTINPANTFLNATYVCWTDTFQLAMALAVGGIYTMNLDEKLPVKMTVATVMLTMSLALYQNYISVFILLALAMLIKELFGSESMFASLKQFACCVAVAIVSVVVYYGLWQIVLFLNPQVTVTSYNGFDSLGDYSNVPIISLLGNAYIQPLTYLLRPETFHQTLNGFADYAVLILSILLIIPCLRNLRESSRRIVVIAAIALLPCCAGCVLIASKGIFHSLMTAPFYFLFIVCLPITQKFLRMGPVKNTLIAGCVSCTCLCLCIIIFSNIVFSNEALLKKDLIYQSTDSMVTRIIDRIEETDGYVIGETPVAIIGNMQDSPLLQERSASFEAIRGVGFFKSALTRTGSIDQWLHVILGYNYNSVSNQEKSVLSETDSFNEMGIFPAADSIRYIDDVLVVKMSSEF